MVVTIGDNDHRDRKVKSRARVAKRPAMTVHREAAILWADADASSSETSVNANRATRTTVEKVAIKRMAKMAPMVMPIVVQESHASAHAIDQTRIAAAAIR